MEKVTEIMIELNKLTNKLIELNSEELKELWTRCDLFTTTGRSDVELYRATSTAARFEWLVKNLV